MDADVPAGLEARIVEFDEVLVEGRGSPDPVARRRVLEALWGKARALGELGRLEESVAVWEQLLRESAGEPPAGAMFLARVLISKALVEHRLGREQAALDTLDRAIDGAGLWASEGRGRVLLAEAWSLKRNVLGVLGERDAERVLNDRIVAEFGEASEPAIRARVEFALARRTVALLREGRVEQALRDSDELLGRFRREQDPLAAERLATLLVFQARSLCRTGKATVGSVAADMGIALAGAVAEGARYVNERGRLERVPGAGRMTHLWESIDGSLLSRIPVAGVIGERRRRARRALVISREVVDRLARDESQHEQVLATARINEAFALCYLGRVRDGVRRIEQLIGTGGEAVAEAFRRHAGAGASDGFVEEIGAVASLAQRARTLGQGDPRIAQVAFEESMRPGAPGSPQSRPAR